MTNLNMIQETIQKALQAEVNRVSLVLDDIVMDRKIGDLNEWRERLETYKEAQAFAQGLNFEKVSLLEGQFKGLADRFESYKVKAAAKIKEDAGFTPRAIKAYKTLKATTTTFLNEVTCIKNLGIETFGTDKIWILITDIDWEISLLDETQM